MTAYSEWLTRVLTLYSPLMTSFGQMQSAHLAEVSLPYARRAALLRPRAADFAAQVRRFNEELSALQQPNVAALGLPSEMQPQALADQLRDATQGLQEVVSGMGETLDHAAAGRMASVERSAHRVSAGIDRYNRTQILLTEARMHSLSTEVPARYVIAIELGFHRLSRLLLDSGAQPSPSLTRNLVALAGELRGHVETGLAKQDAFDRMLAGASPPAGPNSPEAALLTRIQRSSPLLRAQMEVGRELAALIDVMSRERAGGSGLVEHMGTARGIMVRLAELEQRITAGLAAPN